MAAIPGDGLEKGCRTGDRRSRLTELKMFVAFQGVAVIVAEKIISESFSLPAVPGKEKRHSETFHDGNNGLHR
jgi:hypothetical protein